MAQDTQKVSPLRRHLSPLAQILTVAILALFVGVAILAWPVIGKNVADPAGRAQPASSEEARGTFKPTKEQWAGFKIEPVGLVSFRPEQVTEGNIAVDDNLTTPVFSHYSGRVIKVIAMLGDVVAPGAPLFVIHASEFVQAQNDLITALVNLQTARSQLSMAQTTEKRAHDLYLAQGGALKDWQQSQTDLITAQNTVHSDEIALHAVRSRLRILGKTDEEIASLEAQPTQKLNPVAT
jgi:cobalt-zinc-cadmium efflux system membrane fusion protein